VNQGVLINSGQFNGMENLKALEDIAEYLESIDRGRKTVQYRLRDWGISRQRYWGAPIPIINCEKCGIVPVPEKDLPVVLPRDVELTGEGGSPLEKLKTFLEVSCPKCGGSAKRETDTMDTFVESSWYFNRYCSADCTVSPGLDREKIDYWMPVDQYIGGIEHAILHLLYARFYTKMLRDFGVVGVDEPFTNLLTQGMVCKESMMCKEHGYLHPDDVKDGRCVHCETKVTIGKTEKMSKSLKNVVDPGYLIKRYGADTARMFCLFAAPPEKDLEWSDRGVDGAFRFLNRVWRIVMEYIDDIKDVPLLDQGVDLDGDLKALLKKTHQTIRKVTTDIDERFHFNTAISAVMELVNSLYQIRRPHKEDRMSYAVIRRTIETVVVLLSPIVPHITEELWEIIGMKGELTESSWPSYDKSLAAEEEITIVIQVNGKLRGRVQVDAGESDERIKELALREEKVQKFIEGKRLIKEIYVPKKLVNIVVK